MILTVQDCSFRNHLLNMILGLREYEEDISNTTLDNFCQLPIFIESTTENKRQGIKDGVAG